MTIVILAIIIAIALLATTGIYLTFRESDSEAESLMGFSNVVVAIGLMIALFQISNIEKTERNALFMKDGRILLSSESDEIICNKNIIKPVKIIISNGTEYDYWEIDSTKVRFIDNNGTHKINR